MSAFDKVIGYEKEKEELLQLCDMAKNPEKYAALGGEIAARDFVARCAGSRQNADGDCTHRRDGQSVLYLPQG